HHNGLHHDRAWRLAPPNGNRWTRRRADPPIPRPAVGTPADLECRSYVGGSSSRKGMELFIGPLRLQTEVAKPLGSADFSWPSVRPVTPASPSSLLPMPVVVPLVVVSQYPAVTCGRAVRSVPMKPPT